MKGENVINEKNDITNVGPFLVVSMHPSTLRFTKEPILCSPQHQIVRVCPRVQEKRNDLSTGNVQFKRSCHSRHVTA